jgi:Ni/Fe-hydrogenase subunit HybB-like protein
VANAIKRITLWRVAVILIFAWGLYACYLRYFKGWQVATNLSDAQPWGLWVGLSTLCGVGLSAGGFAIAAVVYLLGMERYRPLARVSVLISLLGYSTVCVGYLYELGLPWRAWMIFFSWNHNSVMFDVAYCIMTYTTVLVLEFAPQVLEKLPWRLAHWLAAWQHRWIIGIVLVGTLLSSMHQSFLGGLFLIMKGHIYPLWYSPYLHTLFYLSAIPSGLCMVLLAVHLSIKWLGVELDYGILRDLASVVPALLGVYAVFRLVDILNAGNVQYLFAARSETAYFWVEMLLMVVIPMIALNVKRVQATPALLNGTICIEILGFIGNRLNTSITSMEFSTHAHYVPKWPEIMIALMVITAAVEAFRLSIRYLDVLPRAL